MKKAPVRMRCFSARLLLCPLALVLFVLSATVQAEQNLGPQFLDARAVVLDEPMRPEMFPLFADGHLAAIHVSAEDSETVKMSAQAFSGDLEKVVGSKVVFVTDAQLSKQPYLILIGTLGHDPLLTRLRNARKLDVSSIEGHWESAQISIVQQPFPGVKKALVIAGSDRRGTAFALFTLSRYLGVSPWSWWADVPVRKHKSIAIAPGVYSLGEPSVPYRGIFLNDEDWGLRPWAAQKMDPDLKNIGPNTYAKIFELLLRLRANTLWPAMHPGTLAFNAVKANAELADRWGIVMGSSHSEALLRNNVGEWDEKRDGPWNYQVNRPAIDRYWKQRLIENGKFENFYTVGMRGVHDSGLEATGTPEVKARLVEQVMNSQQQMLREEVNTDLNKIPQVIWLYKESIDLYRVGMHVPENVTLGWTDDNYGYIRQLPSAEEQKRPGGSALYYHVSYWGSPHDHLWLCTTPPALMREEVTKAWDHGARKLWILNVGDIKPAESDIDYFLQLAWNEPRTATLAQREFLESWSAEQFPSALSARIAELLDRYYQLNFIRKPEFMGFNGYNDGVKRTEFNPLAWGDQNRIRQEQWKRLSEEAVALGKHLPVEYRDAYFELVSYPIQASAEQNAKFLLADRSFLDVANSDKPQAEKDAAAARAAYDRIQELTQTYNASVGGKWEGMMSAAPRNRHVFEMPATGESAPALPLPESWCPAKNNMSVAAAKGGWHEEFQTVSINATHFARKQDGNGATWRVIDDLGISGASVVLGRPGKLSAAKWAKSPSATVSDQDAWLEYDFETASEGEAKLALHLLPTFPVDSDSKLRFAVSWDDHAVELVDASGAEHRGATVSPWSTNVLRNSAVENISLGVLKPGHHKLRLIYGDPGVIFEHLSITFANAPPAYPVPPETGSTPSL